MRLRREAVLVTGGTGFVGSYLSVALMRRGVFVVFLARGKADASAQDRIDAVLRWHGWADRAGYAVLDGDVASARFGLPDETYAELAGACREVWHCASDTSFSEKKRDLLHRVNVDGTRHVVAFAADSGTEMVNYISTSYAVGRLTGHCPEAVDHQTDFHNPYEETKHAAERLLLDECDRAGIPYLLYRPSIIIGESTSGRTLAFRGMYYPLKLLDQFRARFLTDLTDNEGRNAGQVGARLDSDGKVFVPLRLVTGGSGDWGINLVPIDFVVDACLAIHADGTPGYVYHVVNDRPVPLREILAFVEDFMDLRGVRIAQSHEMADEPETPLEARFRSLMKVYLPYMCDSRNFALDNTRKILDRHGLSCPQIDRSVLEECVRYAMRVGWTVPLG